MFNLNGKDLSIKEMIKTNEGIERLSYITGISVEKLKQKLNRIKKDVNSN